MVPLNHSKSPVVGPLPDPAPSKSATPQLSDHDQSHTSHNSPGVPRVAPSDAPALRPTSNVPSRKNTYSPSQNSAPLMAPQVDLPTLGQGKTQTVFIHKLYDMLEDSSLSHLIWWSPSNDSFCLYPGEEFSNVLAQYFKHTNIASFIRQLNMYGFHKVNDSFQSDDKLLPAASANNSQPAQSSTRWEFRHSANQFRKGDVQSLSLIKRKSSKVINSHKEIVNLKTLPPTSNAAVDDKQPQYPDQSQQQYHRSVYQLLWDQMSDAASTQLVSPKISTPASLYAPPAVVAYHGFPGYPHLVAAQNVPHSPGSPPYPDHGTSPSYIHQPQLRPELRQPSVQTPGLPVDQLITLKLIEMNNAIANLKAGYLELLSRNEYLTGLYQRSQTELLQLTEIVEKILANSGEPDLKAESIDRSKTKTPVGRMTTPSHDSGMSPMSVKPQQKASDLDSFKQQLVLRINQPIPTVSSSSKNSLHNYHLNDVSLTLSKGSSNYNIVPQHYPLNPNYSLYNNSESVFRHFKMSSEDLQQQQQQQQQQQRQAAAPPNRHVSILMDPLQPIPGRAPATVPTSLGPDGKEKTAPENSTPHYVQQYQPLAMHQPPVHAIYQYIRQEAPLQQRTVSLPIIEKPLTASATGQQRHSTTTLPQPQLPHQPHQPQPRLLKDVEAEHHSLIMRGQSPLSRGPYPPAPQVPPAQVGQTPQPGQPGQQGQVSAQSTQLTPAHPVPSIVAPHGHQMPAIQTPVLVQGQPAYPVQLKLEHPSPPVVNSPPRDTRLPLRNQLPSVSELDKSIKSSGRVYDLLLDSGEDRSKKRKVET